jgi:hypothetical protein
MKTMTLALAAAMLLALAAPTTTVHGDMGTFTTDDGQDCSWTSYGNTADIDCSGYSWRAHEYVRFHCDYDFYGRSASWRCRDSHGNTWSGSR